MSLHSKIEWTEATWNPVRGCSKVSPGCKHCYAETFAERFRNVPGHPYEQGFDPRIVPHKLLEPLTWSKPRIVFVNSMSDLFQDAVPDEYITTVARIMLAANWHTYQILTKRAERLNALLTSALQDAARVPHIWWGVSIEDKRHGLPRLDLLRTANAKTRFLSIEPLLEDLGTLDLSDIAWVIVGGESGHGARPMKQSWVENLQRQCSAARVAFFFKQWGGVNKAKAGRLLNGRTYDEMPQPHGSPPPTQALRQAILQSLLPETRQWMTNEFVLLQAARSKHVA